VIKLATGCPILARRIKLVLVKLLCTAIVRMRQWCLKSHIITDTLGGIRFFVKRYS
jgi:hypothetical protein